jgi:hypothetical protein
MIQQILHPIFPLFQKGECLVHLIVLGSVLTQPTELLKDGL